MIVTSAIATRINLGEDSKFKCVLIWSSLAYAA